MRIALDCRSVFPGRGGIGHYAEMLAKHLPKADGNHDYFLLAPERQKDVIVADKRVTQIAFNAAMIDEVWEQLQLPAVLEEHQIDLYHNPCFSLPIVKSVRWQVATIHDVVFRTRPDLVAPTLRSYLDRWSEHSLEAANAIITATETSRHDITQAYGAGEKGIHIIPHGVGEKFRKCRPGTIGAKLKKEYQLPERFVLYLGAIEAKKNIARLLEAFAILVTNGRAGKAKLVLAGGGGGGAYDVKAAIARAGLEDHVIVTGYVSDEAVVPLINMAESFVYPSLYEGFGLPPLEAMACGIPTVVSDATCLPEVVGDGALIAPATDAEGLAEQIGRLMGDAALQKTMSRRGQNRAKEFTWERTAKKTLDLYEAVAGRDS